MRVGQAGFVGATGARLRFAPAGILPLAAATLALGVCVVWALRDRPELAVLCVLLGLLQMALLLKTLQAQAEVIVIERARLNSVIEGAGVCVWEWNASTGETRVNESWAGMLGYGIAELPADINAFWRNCVHPDDLQLADARFPRHADGQLPSYEADLRLRHRAGHWVRVRSRGKVIARAADGRPTWVSGVYLDVTELREMEEDLRASQAVIERAGRMSGVGSWEVQLTTGEIYWSPQTCLILERPVGYRPTMEEAMAHYPPQSRPVVEALMQRMSDGQTVEPVEVPMLTTTGKRRLVRILGEALLPDRPGEPLRRLVGSYQDVTDARQIEEELRSSEMMLDRAGRIGGVGGWEVDLPTGQVIWSPQMCLSLGRPIGFRPTLDDCLQHCAPADRAAVEASLGRMIQGPGVDEVEVTMISTTGKPVLMRVIGEALPPAQPGGPVVRLVGSSQDVTQRRALEEAMRQSHELLRSVVDNVPCGLVAWADDGSLITHNRQFQRMMDIPDDWFASADMDFHGYLERNLQRGEYGDGDEARAAVEQMKKFGAAPAGVSFVRTRPNGTLIEVRGGKLPGRGFVAMCTDLTERRALEQAMERSNAILRNIVENLPCSLVVYDDKLQMIVHNEQFKRLWNLPDSLFEHGLPSYGKVVDWFVHRNDAGADGSFEEQVQAYLDYARNPGPMRGEFSVSGGTMVEVCGAALPGGGLIFTGSDITERLRSERLLRDAMEAIDEAFVLFDPEDRLVYCNDKYRQVHAEVAELLQPGVHFEQVLRAQIALDAAHEAHGNEDAWLARRLDEHRRGETKFEQRTGTGRWWRVIERRLPDGHIAGFRIDITDLMQATEAAEKASLAKSQFLANMSHEIRTPMNAVLGMLKLLQRTELSPRQLDYAIKTEGAARSLLGLLNDILDFSKVEAGKMSLDLQPMRIDELLRDLSVILAANVGQREIEVLFDVDPHLPRCVIADAMRLQQVLVNLAGNALKFTPQGEVVVQLKLVALEAEGVTLDFGVRDTGIGIAPEHQEQIFSGFTQAEASTTRRFGGTGLGLSISRRLLQLMGSELQLESRPGQGSHFFFRLHLDLPGQQPEPEQGLSRQPAHLGPLKVLVVDDHRHARELLASMCESLGWQVDMADSGDAALALVRASLASTQPYEVALIDWAMPELDGWETSRAVRKLSRGEASSPVIVMVSAHGRDMLSQRSHREQGLLDAFLVKPVTASMLYDAVADARATGPKTDFDMMHGALQAVDAVAAARADGGAIRTMAPSRPRQHRAQRLAGLRLMVVEDNLNNQQVARELLEDEGATVVLAGDGQQALSHLALSRQGPKVDAVLMDVQMPLMDGYTATRLIRRQLRMTLPIIAMTANARSSDREACLDAGMTEHVGKPFDIDHLVAVLQRHCGTGAAVGAQERRGTPPSGPGLPQALLEQAGSQGIELGQAFARMSGRTELFARTIQALADAAQALPSPPTASALHALRGLAITLGASELAELAAQGEYALECDPAALPGPWQPQFETTLQRSLSALQGLALLLPAESVQDLIPAELGSGLATLVDLLDGSDMAAFELFARLRQGLRARRPAAEALLDETLNQLEFAGAAGQCRALLRELAA